MPPGNNFVDFGPEPFLKGFEIGLDLFRGKFIVSGRHRGMGGKNRCSWNDLPGGFEINAMGLYHLRQAFEAGKSRVPFVHMADCRLDAHGVESPHPADTQEYFLGQPGFALAGIKCSGDVSNFSRIFSDIGVKQIKGDAADHDFPDDSMDFTNGS